MHKELFKNPMKRPYFSIKPFIFSGTRGDSPRETPHSPSIDSLSCVGGRHANLRGLIKVQEENLGKTTKFSSVGGWTRTPGRIELSILLYSCQNPLKNSGNL